MKEGRFCWINGTRITTKEVKSEPAPYHGVKFRKEHIFIIDKYGDIYLCYNSETVNHVSMTNYKPVIGSGRIILNDGKIELLSI